VQNCCQIDFTNQPLLYHQTGKKSMMSIQIKSAVHKPQPSHTGLHTLRPAS
jgi:hypothetical protein